MRYSKMLGLVGVLLVGASLVVKADSWDVGPQSDNTLASTPNQLTHGMRQDHDLAAVGAFVDVDYYSVPPATTLASYEVVVDGASTGVDFTVADRLTRRDAANAILQTSVGSGSSLSLKWAGGAAQEYILVGPASCGIGCTADTRYTIRFYETTIAVPRFNNGGSQITVLLLQNAGSTEVTADAYFWDGFGNQIAQLPYTIAAKGVGVSNLNQGPLVGTAGAITITHNAGYGGLVVKSIALEPATGFSFDSPGVYKPI